MRLHALHAAPLERPRRVRPCEQRQDTEEARIVAFWVNDDGTAEHAVGASTAVLDSVTRRARR